MAIFGGRATANLSIFLLVLSIFYCNFSIVIFVVYIVKVLFSAKSICQCDGVQYSLSSYYSVQKPLWVKNYSTLCDTEEKTLQASH